MPAQPSKSGIPAAVRDAALRGEPDRYLAATLAPSSQKMALAAIAAFSAELQRIPATVSQPMLGDIRLQWWRETIQGDAKGLSGHPVADALVEAQRRHSIDRDLLMQMIDAREFDLSGGLPQDDRAMSAYFEAIEGSAFRASLKVFEVDATSADALAASAGLAYGIARATCRLPMLVHNGGVPLPADRLRRAGIDPATLAEQPPARQTSIAVQQVAEELKVQALEELAAVRFKARKLSRLQRTALLPLVMVEPYFRAQSGRALLEEMIEVSPLVRCIRMGVAHVRGRL